MWHRETLKMNRGHLMQRGHKHMSELCSALYVSAGPALQDSAHVDCLSTRADSYADPL